MKVLKMHFEFTHSSFPKDATQQSVRITDGILTKTADKFLTNTLKRTQHKNADFLYSFRHFSLGVFSIGLQNYK